MSKQIKLNENLKVLIEVGKEVSKYYSSEQNGKWKELIKKRLGEKWWKKTNMTVNKLITVYNHIIKSLGSQILDDKLENWVLV